MQNPKFHSLQGFRAPTSSLEIHKVSDYWPQQVWIRRPKKFGSISLSRACVCQWHSIIWLHGGFYAAKLGPKNVGLGLAKFHCKDTKNGHSNGKGTLTQSTWQAHMHSTGFRGGFSDEFRFFTALRPRHEIQHLGPKTDAMSTQETPRSNINEDQMTKFWSPVAR